MMSKRFVERDDVSTLINKHPDFIVRYHDRITKSVAYAFIISMVCIIVFSRMFYAEKLNIPEFIPLQYADIYIIIGGITLILSILSFYIYTVVVKTRYVVMVLEFQNLMFASAAKTDSLFCMIANDDDKIVYFDQRSELIFEEEELKRISSFVLNQGITKQNQTKILQALKNRDSVEVPFSYKQSGKNHRVKMMVDPLERPKNYVVIRGYEK